MERENLFQRQHVGQPPGHIHITNTNSVENAMFNGIENVAIYGGKFVQHNIAKRGKDGFMHLRERVAHSAFHNSAQRVDPPRCHPNTRVAILQSIYDWIVQQECREQWLLWLNGAAGAGKSAIMQSAAEHCVLAAIAIASFFFSRADLTRNNMARFIATLVYQLIQVIPETSDDILLTIERNPLIFEQSLESQLQQLLIQPLLRLPAHLQRLFVVFIDGLDECKDRAHQSNLIRALGNISSGRNIPVVFIIASRPEPQIGAGFCQGQVADNLATIPLDAFQAYDDIRWYLTEKFNEIKATHLRKRFLSPDWPSSAVIEEIVEKSSGQFIYASVVMGYISLPYAHPAIQLDVIKGIHPRNPSENPFAHLDALYRYIFSQVKRLDAVRNILAFYLIDSFWRIAHLELVFQLATGELDVLFSDLTGVIRCSGNPFLENITILHASLPEFLLDKSRSGEHYIDVDEYRINLLSMFLERPSLIPDPHSWAPTSKHDPDAELGECWRLHTISWLLGQVEATDRLQRALMNFDCIIYSSQMITSRFTRICSILGRLKNLNLKDWSRAYHHTLRVFAAAIARYWSLHYNDKEDKDWIGPDLLPCIDQIQQKKRNLKDRSQAYHPTLGVFAAAIARHWSLNINLSLYQEDEAIGADLLACIDQIQQEELWSPPLLRRQGHIPEYPRLQEAVVPLPYQPIALTQNYLPYPAFRAEFAEGPDAQAYARDWNSVGR